MTHRTYSVNFPDALSAHSAAATILNENPTARCTVVRRGHRWSVVVSYEDEP